MKTKWCNKCKNDKSVDDFNKNGSNKTGLSDWCRECNRNRSAKLREKDRNAYNNKLQEYRRKRMLNPKYREKMRIYRENIKHLSKAKRGEISTTKKKEKPIFASKLKII